MRALTGRLSYPHKLVIINACNLQMYQQGRELFGDINYLVTGSKAHVFFVPFAGQGCEVANDIFAKKPSKRRCNILGSSFPYHSVGSERYSY